MPIIDYHCHLIPREICENRQFKNITEIWLGGDHYKWRVMRSNGIEDVLNEKSARSIFDKCNKMIESGGFSAMDFIEKSNVETICTTDDPVDSLEYHIELKKQNKVKVLPAFRPDKAVNCEQETFIPYIKELEKVAGMTISDVDGLLSALEARIDFFHSVGCRVSDHALAGVPFGKTDKDMANASFKKAMAGDVLSEDEINAFKTYMLLFFTEEYHKRDWAMQLHIGALRNNNTSMYKKLGPDTGFDSIDNKNIAAPLSALLNACNEKGRLPKTILYTLNPKDNYVLGTMLGNFQGTEAPSKIQFGSGWWFNDQRDGMKGQMRTLAYLGLLGRFVGMLTDSRSFLSYTRHEYFRRIMCNLLGTWVEAGEYPADFDALGEIVKGISNNNAKNYFNF